MPAQSRVSNELPYTVFHAGTIDGFKGAVHASLAASLSLFFSFSVARCLWGCGNL